MNDYNDILLLKKGYLEKQKELEIALSNYSGLSEKMAAAERDYLTAKAKAFLELKDEGQQATLIPTLAKGRVANHRFDFKVAEGVFHAARENIKRLHANLEGYRTLISSAKKEMEIR